MKLKNIILCAALLACASLSNCASDPTKQKRQLSTLASIAVNALATANPQQATLIRSGGTLVIKAINGEDIKLEEASNIAIDYAVAQKKLTPEEAEQLRASTTVPLTPGPSNPMLPPPGAGL